MASILFFNSNEVVDFKKSSNIIIIWNIFNNRFNNYEIAIIMNNE